MSGFDTLETYTYEGGYSAYPETCYKFKYITDAGIHREHTICVARPTEVDARYRAGHIFRKMYAELRKLP